MGVLYILDEPSIGLHQRDNDRLIATLVRLRDLGNTLLIVEHDEETIRSADWVIDIGPAAGEHGGRLIHSGPLDGLLENHRSITAAYLRGDKAVPMPKRRRNGQGRRDRGARCAREQPEVDRRGVPAGPLRGRHRRQRVGQVARS